MTWCRWKTGRGITVVMTRLTGNLSAVTRESALNEFEQSRRDSAWQILIRSAVYVSARAHTHVYMFDFDSSVSRRVKLLTAHYCKDVSLLWSDLFQTLFKLSGYVQSTSCIIRVSDCFSWNLIGLRLLTVNVRTFERFPCVRNVFTNLSV